VNMVIFFAAVAATAFLYTILPLLRPRQGWLPAGEEGTRRQALEAEKRAFLRAMQDIDFEHASGKINDRDHAELRDHYATEAARVIGEIDRLETAGPGRTSSPAAAESHREETPGPPPGDDSVAPAARIAALREKLEQLEIGWEMGEIRNDTYFSLRDSYRAELDTLADGLQEQEEQKDHGCS